MSTSSTFLARIVLIGVPHLHDTKEGGKEAAANRSQPYPSVIIGHQRQPDVQGGVMITRACCRHRHSNKMKNFKIVQGKSVVGASPKMVTVSRVPVMIMMLGDC
jgi:hypothetical protein